MQIHEITQLQQVNEGLLDLAKKAAGGVRGAVQGYQDSTRSRAVADVANKASKIWLQYARQLKAANPDQTRYATLYKQALAAFVQKNLLKGQAISSAINRQEIEQGIDNIAAAEADPAQVTKLMSNLVQQASVSQQDVSSRETRSQGQLISQDPAIVKLDGRTYGLNDNGQWADIKNGRIPDDSVGGYLDQIVGIK